MTKCCNICHITLSQLDNNWLIHHHCVLWKMVALRFGYQSDLWWHKPKSIPKKPLKFYCLRISLYYPFSPHLKNTIFGTLFIRATTALDVSCRKYLLLVVLWRLHCVWSCQHHRNNEKCHWVRLQKPYWWESFLKQTTCHQGSVETE